MPRHHEYHFWSMALGDYACRLSVTGREGWEFWMIIARPSHGREWRDARAAAVEAICAAADSGLEPGEVLVGDARPYPRSPFAAQARRDAAAERARGGHRGPPTSKPGLGSPRPPLSESGKG
jgi:hypothetical protein